MKTVYINRVYSKSEFQAMRRALLSQDMPIVKIENGYEMVNKNGVLLLKAMNGNNSYLVRMVDNLFA
jgi:hypothetical protein